MIFVDFIVSQLRHSTTIRIMTRISKANGFKKISSITSLHYNKDYDYSRFNYSFKTLPSITSLHYNKDYDSTNSYVWPEHFISITSLHYNKDYDNSGLDA